MLTQLTASYAYFVALGTIRTDLAGRIVAKDTRQVYVDRP